MPEQHFTLTMRCTLNDQRLDALVEAGCDDATFSTKGAQPRRRHRQRHRLG